MAKHLRSHTIQHTPMPPMAAAATADELLEAEAVLWCHAYGYLKSMALQCAINLGIPNAIHRRGGAASLSELRDALPAVAAGRWPCLSRLVRFLASTGVFAAAAADDPTAGDGDGARYRLTAVSRLLVDDGAGHRGLTAAMLLYSSPFHVKAAQCLAGWLQAGWDGGAGAGAAAAETPFAMAHGEGFYGVAGRDAAFGASFNEAMASDSRFVAEIVVRECGKVFDGVTSLVDAGGGDGTMARAIAMAFPHLSCSVLELPYMVDAAPADGTVEFVAGDMMQFIPPADVVLLKCILHNWSDEECVRILKRSREAICTREPKGKVIIIDVVVGSQSKQTLEAQLLMDLCMMTLTTGEERDQDRWHRIFIEAGFTRYKIRPILGCRSLIELYL